jgi:hypothetical protein
MEYSTPLLLGCGLLHDAASLTDYFQNLYIGSKAVQNLGLMDVRI